MIFQPNLYIVVWDHGWEGADIVVTSNPDQTIEKWRKADYDKYTERANNHNPNNGDNPWLKYVDHCIDTESFMRYNYINTYDIEDGLSIMTDGDSY